jgi:hypothetical protein
MPMSVTLVTTRTVTRQKKSYKQNFIIVSVKYPQSFFLVHEI